MEVLRIQYDPARYNFHTRYVYSTFPPEILQRLEPLFFVSDIAQLHVKFSEAQRFFEETLAQINLDTVARNLGTAVG